MGTDFLIRQEMETKRWKDVRHSISKLQEEMESHMTFYLESRNQDPGRCAGMVCLPREKIGDQ